ncbi:MAG: DNA-binding protein [Nocardia sp.]|uniref:Zn-ribbon domain-containing OB-fold protein n=1 Tax=Nocardia sp. TaxID=1821 RepID=UPI00261AD383|nr:OB-fold domain-containing protein [Nocardia sp.]MCU1641341.1 DNA-binding protein [Nocardia sp.]
MKPEPTPETAPYWEGAAQGELRIQRCRTCGRHYFYPRPFCRYCGGEGVEWVAVSGRARLVSYVISHRPVPGHEPLSPVIALVELDEGPRLMTNLLGVDPDPEKLPLDMRLTVTFAEHQGAVLPYFEPAKG